MTQNEHSRLTEAALALRKARESRQSVPPISQTFGIATLAEAYEVAAINSKTRVECGARVIGKKVGLTSKAVQQQLGVDQPDFGLLFDDMEYLNGQDIPASHLMQPKVEAEVAFIMGRDLQGEVPSWSEFLLSVTHALPALEVVDSAITDWKISLVDTVADNASCGVYVLGDQPVSIGGLFLGQLGMSLSKNGAVVSVGAGAACLAHPLRAAYWLAKTMAERGEPLRAGEIILSGALGPMVPLVAGDLVSADIGALGTVSCRLV